MRHFEAGGTIWGVSEGARQGPHLARVTARKILDHVRAGRLSWVTQGVPVDPGGPADSAVGQTDLELGPHARELFAFGVRFRDRLLVPDLPFDGHPSGAWWQSRHWSAPPLAEPEAAAIERDWGGYGPFDARRHPVFPLFASHLSATSLAALLAHLDAAQQEHLAVFRRTVAAVEVRVREQLPMLAAEGLRSLTQSLVTHLRLLAAGGAGLQFTYPMVQVQGAAERYWTLRLGAWQVGQAGSADDLKPLAQVHQALAQALAGDETVRSLMDRESSVRSAIAAVQAMLTPDAELRRLVRLGACRSCVR